MDAGVGWILFAASLPIAYVGLLVWAGLSGRHRLLLYGIFAAGLLLSVMSLLVCWGNALTGEGWRGSIEKAGILGMIAGSIIACAALMIRALMLRPLAPFGPIIAGALAGAGLGWLLGSLWVNGAGWTLERIVEGLVRPEDRFPGEWVMAVCLTPYGMWLVLIAGVKKAAWIFLAGLVLLLSQNRSW